MSRIDELVGQIRTAIYGKDVRESIAEGIELCYEETGTAAITKISGTDDDYRVIFSHQE